MYEEAIASVVTVRDFSMVFDAYRNSRSRSSARSSRLWRRDLTADEQLDVDMRLARLERLMERRPNCSVLLRQSPHSVHEWLKRPHLRV